VVTSSFTDDPAQANRLFAEYIRKAVALDPSDGLARVMLGGVRALAGDDAGAASELERALALAPNDADVLIVAAWNAALFAWDAPRCLEVARHALRLNTKAPSWYFIPLGITE
jgi:tetratricopeptide (TPR) repeat protein